MKKGDTFVIVWIGILCLAGRINDGGNVYVTEGVPYDTNTLSAELSVPAKIVAEALDCFVKYRMIAIEDGVIRLLNWSKYQAEDKLEKMRERDRERKRLSRACPRTVHGMSADSPRTKVGIEEQEQEYTLSLRESESAQARTPAQKDIYGKFRNVLLTQEEYQAIKSKYPDHQAMIDRLSAYLAKHPEKYYGSHYHTVIAWADEDAAKATGSFDTDEFFEAALERSRETTKKLREMYGGELPVTGQGGRHEE